MKHDQHRRPHITTKYNNDLENVSSLIASMGDQVEAQLNKSIQLFTDKENIEERAKTIISDDKKINALEVAVTNSCIFLITRYSPKAEDLRLVLSILRTSSELERIGDTVSKICHAASESQHVIPSIIEKINIYAKNSVTLLHDSMKALSIMDINLAKEVYLRDDTLDDEYLNIFAELTESAKTDIEYLPEYINAIIALKQIERIGDRCKNICEFVYYYNFGEVANKNHFLNIQNDIEQ